jgi:hopene-associated glycosyltransferase HpnB
MAMWRLTGVQLVGGWRLPVRDDASVSGAVAVAVALAAVSAVIWLYLTVGHGRFWRPCLQLPARPDPMVWPSVVVVVPARNEAPLLPATLPTLVQQAYPGPYRVLVVDDNSDDDTAAVAAELGADVVRTSGPPPGWAGKVAAMAAGVRAAGSTEFVLFTDADIAHPQEGVAALVRAAHAEQYGLVSLMVRLRTVTRWERLIVPAFVYFFAALYPFAWVNGPGRTAAAAGGCMLVRRSVLERAGGMAAIAGAAIDDVAVGRLLKPHARIRLGHTTELVSIRPYPRLADLWDMVARSAYTQLRYSPWLLVGTVAALLLTFGMPPAALIGGLAAGRPPLAALGALGWVLMSLTYLPTLSVLGVRRWWAPTLPAAALLYLAMTLDSARRHRAGHGGTWKGRSGR